MARSSVLARPFPGGIVPLGCTMVRTPRMWLQPSMVPLSVRGLKAKNLIS